MEPMERTPAEIMLERGLVADKAARFDEIRGNFESAEAGLDAAERTLNEILELMDRVASAGLGPDRRVKLAARVGALLDSLHQENPMFAFVTQSYVYLSSVELAKTRFLDTVELVESWRAFHAEIVDAHASVLQFIRKWLGYTRSALEYYVSNDLPMTPLEGGEAMRKLEAISAELGDGHDQTRLRMEMDALFGLCDPVRLEWPGRILWQCAMFLLQEGRAEEATVMMDYAARGFDGAEMPTDEIVSFLKDYARVLMTGDLCHLPDYHKAELIIKNIIGFAGNDAETRELMNETLDGQVSIYSSLAQATDGRRRGIAGWFASRAAGGEALSSGDIPRAMRLIWRAVCEYGEYLPDWASSHLEWLSANLEKFFGAIDEPYKSMVDELLGDMASRSDVISKFGARYTGAFIDALGEHGMETGIFKEVTGDGGEYKILQGAKAGSALSREAE
jgi:hypothetical protein